MWGSIHHKGGCEVKEKILGVEEEVGWGWEGDLMLRRRLYRSKRL